MQPLRCILMGTEIVPAPDEAVFVRWMQDLDNRQVAHTRLEGERYISTIFLGVNAGTESKPEWFETIVVGVPTHRAESNQYLQHSHDYADAMRVHEAMVTRAKAQMGRRKTPSA